MTAFDKAWEIVKGDEYVSPTRRMEGPPVDEDGDGTYQSMERLLAIVSENIPGYHGLTNEQLIDVIREEGITGLTTDEVAQMRDARDSGGFDEAVAIGNAEALIALRQKIMEM
jgi:hypothetical protein